MTQLIPKIIGTGSYLPEKRLTNADLTKMVDTSDEWIYTRTGIRERRIASPGELTSDLAFKAARRAIEAADIAADDLDLIILATSTGDKLFPATATIVQDRLGIASTTIPAFDMLAVCSGFMFALSTAEAYIRSGMMQRILVIGAETNSRIVDWTDRGTCILFGDGAGAVILEAAEKGPNTSGILSTHIHADGAHGSLLQTTGGISAGAPEGSKNGGLGLIEMKGNEV